MFDHHTRWWSLGSLQELARQLNSQIGAKWLEAGGFDDIVLVGHSMGGLIVRQAYLLGVGAVPGEDPYEWAAHVARIVLLASLNRGIDPNRTGWIRPIWWISRVIPFMPHLRGQDVVQGSNFLTNLRINWIRHFGRLEHQESTTGRWPDGRSREAPLVVQLLGSKDGIVRKEDSKDVFAFPGGHYLDVPDANHLNLYWVTPPPAQDLRYAVLREGFVGSFVNKAEQRHRPTLHQGEIKRVVFLLHGIRASNTDKWIEELEKRIKDRDPKHTVVRHPTYGYFTAVRFALPTVRKRNIRVFQDWYTEALAEYPTAEFNIIAHSNGTYMLGQSLLATPGMQFKHVALAGSVLPTDFDWQQLKGQVERVRNDRASRDWPVALLCSALRGWGMGEVGTAGFAGFNGGHTTEIAYYQGHHGVALKPEYHDRLVDFIFGGNPVAPPTLISSPGCYRQLSNAMPYMAVLLALLIIVPMVWFSIHGWWSPLLWSALGAVLTYVVLDVV